MTESPLIDNEEALKRIRDMMREQTSFLQTRNTYALSMAYEALHNKSEAEGYRTPKWPVEQKIERQGRLPHVYTVCPTCGYVLDDLLKSGFEPPYCIFCGQKLDWTYGKEADVTPNFEGVK